MNEPSLRYRVPSRVSDRSIVEALADRWRVKLAEIGKSRRTYLDTADSRLLKGGWTLAYHWSDVGPTLLEISSAADDSVIARGLIDEPPQWAADLPDGSSWALLAAAVGDRRLLNRMTIDTSGKRYAVLDDEAKTTLRVNVERHVRADGDGRVHRLRLITLVPVRGYEKYQRAASKVLSDAGLPIHEGSLVAHLADTGPIRAGVPHPPETTELDRSMPVALAVSGVLSSLRNEMVSNEAGVRDQLDIEFLHDYRVASRRARSVLNQVRGLIPTETAEALYGELRWLGTLTGPPRDLDVQLGETYDGVDGLQGMRRLLLGKRAEAQVALVAALDSQRYKSLLDTWERLEEGASALSRSGGGAQPAGTAIDHRISRAHRRVLRIGKSITDASPAEALHDLRKKTKALRYMLEMFAPLYSGSELKAAVRELKAFQDNLGEFQDSQVQAGVIRDLADEILETRSGSASELMAMGRIADALESRQVRARAEFAERFARFAAPDVTRRYRRMFGPIREDR